MRKTQFTKFIQSLNEEELREELDKLYTKYKPIKEYYAMELGEEKDRSKLLEKAKNQIEKLYERRKTRSRLSKVNAILKNISAISIFDHELAEVYLTHVESAVNHINYWGMRAEADGAHMLKSFKMAVDLTARAQIMDKNHDRLEKVIDKMHYFTLLHQEMGTYLDDYLE